MTALTGDIKKDLLKSNKNPKIRSMNHQNLANLTKQYQQVYLIYCYKIMQYLQALAWLTEQQCTTLKPKSALGVKKSTQKVNQQKPTLKSLKHQEKADVSTNVALGFPNGAMSAAFRVAFNELAGNGQCPKQACHDDNVKTEKYTYSDRNTFTTSIDGLDHTYEIRGLICSTSTSGCNESYADKVFNHVNLHDVPFNDDGSRTGRYILKPIWFLSGDPINHTANIAARTSLNTTFKEHRFHPGTVAHKVHFENGNLYYDVIGTGRGSNPSFNNGVGEYLFRPGVEATITKFRLD